jgi:hypothetical protein
VSGGGGWGRWPPPTTAARWPRGWARSSGSAAAPGARPATATIRGGCGRSTSPSPWAGQLRVLSKERSAPGSGTTWRSAVPAEQRALITSLVNDAEEQLTQLRGAQYGKTADAAQQLLGNLGHAATLLEQAVRETAAGALTAGMALEDLARWAHLPADVLAEALADHHSEQQEKGR